MASSRKEAGVIWTTGCMTCGETLAVGWLGQGGLIVPLGLSLVRPAPQDAQGIARGPLTCQCGRTTLRLHEAVPRGVAEWRPDTQEPRLVGTVVQGSIREGAVPGDLGHGRAR